MDGNSRYWRLGSCIIDVTKISFIKAFDETAGEGMIVVDGQLIKLAVNQSSFIYFVEAFAREHPAVKIFA
jgi:hypothetical protein